MVFSLNLLSDETRCAILSKMTPLSFVRMRKTGRFMDQYAEDTKKHIGMRLDYLKICCQTMEFDHEGNEEAVVTVRHKGLTDYVVNKNPTLPYVTTTAIFRSLSGFSFEKIEFYSALQLRNGDALFSLLGKMKKRCSNLDLVLQDPLLVEIVKPNDVTMRLEYFNQDFPTAIPVPSALPFLPNVEQLYICMENCDPSGGPALIQRIKGAKIILLSPRHVPRNEVCQLMGGILSAWQKGDCFGRIETLLIQSWDRLRSAEQAVKKWYSIAVKETAYEMRAPELEASKIKGTTRARAELRTPWRQGGMFTITATHYKKIKGCEIQPFFFTERKESISTKETFPRIYIGGYSL